MYRNHLKSTNLGVDFVKKNLANPNAKMNMRWFFFSYMKKLNRITTYNFKLHIKDAFK